MSTDHEELDLELKRTQLLREQLALRQELDRYERPAKAAKEFKGATQAVKIAAEDFTAAAAPVVIRVARFAAFAAMWVALVGAADLAIAGNDALKLKLPFEALTGYYFFWALLFGTIWALIAWPWPSLPTKEKSAKQTLWRLAGGWLLMMVAAPYAIRWLSFQP